MAERAQILIRAKDETAGAFSSVQSHFRGMSSTLAQLAPQIAAALSIGGVIAFAKSAIDAGEAMNDMSQRTGLSVESLSKWKFVAEQSGATLESIQPGLKGLAQNMESAARGSKESADAFARLGVPVKDGAGNLRQMDAVMLDLAEKFQSMPDGAQKTALAVRIFGKAGQELIPTLNQGKDGIADLMATAERLGLVMSGDAAKAADELNDSLNLIKQAGSALSTQFLNEAAPAISQIARAMAEAARDGGLFAAAIRGYGEAWKVLLFGADPSQMERQREFIRDLDKEIRQLEKDIPIQEKAGILGRFSGGDPVEMKRKLEALILTVNSARVAMRLMEEQANKPPVTPPVTVTPTGGLGEDAEKKRKAAEASAKELRALMNESDELFTKDRDNTIEATRLHQQADEARAVALAKLIEESDAMWEKDRDNTIARNERKTEIDNIERDRLFSNLFNEREALRASYEADFDALNDANANKLIANEQYYQLMGRLVQKNIKAQTALEDDAIKKRFGINQVYRKLDLNSASFFFNQMSALMQTKSRTMFEIGKAAAIGETIVNTHRAAMGAYAALAKIPIIGPALGVAAAAAAILAGGAQVAAISKATMGGGGAVGTFAANPSTGLPESPTSSGFEAPPSPLTQQGIAAAPAQQINFTIVSDSGLISTEWMRDKFAPAWNELMGDRVNVTIVSAR